MTGVQTCALPIYPENGYRYYVIEQLETMLLIIRLKSYNFSLEEIKQMVESGELDEEIFSVGDFC